MRINKLKNYIGLCAIEGCRHKFKVLVEVKSKTSDGRLINEHKFWVCNEHTWNLLNFNYEED